MAGQGLPPSHTMCGSRNIHTHPTEGHWKFLRSGVLKAKFLEAMYDNKPEFPGGRGMQNNKPSVGGSVDIFWNSTIH